MFFPVWIAQFIKLAQFKSIMRSIKRHTTNNKYVAKLGGSRRRETVLNFCVNGGFAAI